MKYNLKDGFYWVKIDDNLTWTIMQWSSVDNMWIVGGMPMFEPFQVKHVNSKRLIPPDEQPKISIAYEPTFNKNKVDDWFKGVEQKWLCIKCGKEECNCK